MREYIEGLFTAHSELHKDHADAHAREHDFAQKAIDLATATSAAHKLDADAWRKLAEQREDTFATKTDVDTLTTQIRDLKDAEIRRLETERVEIANAEKKRQDDRAAQTRQQWIIGTAIGVAVVLINLLIRALSATPSP